MTSGLRKAHKYIWLIIMVAVPILIFFSLKNLDIFYKKKNSVIPFESTKKNIVKVAENELIKASVINKDSTYFIEIILKSTLKNASSVVYRMDKKGNKVNIIGQLTTAGIYNFNINNLPQGIIISDDLKHIDITKFSFQWD